MYTFLMLADRLTGKYLRHVYTCIVFNLSGNTKHVSTPLQISPPVKKRIPSFTKIILTTILLLFLFPTDSPALEVRDGAFYEAGKRVRLWGVHLTPGLSIADYKVTDAMIPRIRSMGFNAIAVWGISEMFREGVPDSRKGDKSRMDRLDYLIYKCREAGIYVWFAAAARIPRPRIEDYEGETSGGVPPKQRYKSVQKLQEKSPSSHIAKHAVYLDKGLQKAKLRFITQLLNHVNPYTNKPYKNQDGIILYLSDENGFISNAAAAVRYPKNRDPYTTRLLMHEVEKYNNPYYAVFDIARKWHKELMSKVKSLAPTMPVNLDTTHRARLFDLYICKDADFCAYGTGGSQDSGSETMLKAPPSFNNKLHGSREFKIKGKPWVMYTGNPRSSADYRAEWPLRIAAYASFQDADGVFFWNWAHGFSDNKSYSKLPIYNPKLDKDISADEVLLSAANIAGQIFIHEYIPAASNPVTFTFGKKALLSWKYGYTWNETEAYRKLRNAAYTSGARIELDLEQDIEYTQDRPVDEPLQNPLIWKNPEGNRQVLWDWNKGILVIDTPEAKAITGFTEGGYRFMDGVTLDNLNKGFATFGIVSENGRPIVSSNSHLVSLVSKSRNTGFARGAGDTVLHAGSAPAIKEQISGRLTLPAGQYEITDIGFTGQTSTRTSSSDGKIILGSNRPSFVTRITPLKNPAR